MNIYDQFPSKYLRASDLQGRRVKAKVDHIVQEILGNDTKTIIYFAGQEKGMVCNRTNAMTIAESWGPETDNWIGGDIEIFSTKVPFQGKLTDSLRVRPLPTQAAARGPVPPASRPTPPPPASPDEYGEVDEEIPF